MDQEPKILSFFSRISDFLLLNILFVITSIPLFTIGASLTALYSVSLKMVRGEESYVYRDYFHAFKLNFKLAVPSFLFFLFVFAVCGMNIFISYQTPGLFYLILRALATIFSLCAFICMKYYFPILARFKFSWKQIWMHIPHMLLTHPLDFLFLVLLNIPVIFLAAYSVFTALFTLILAALFGCAVFSYVESFFFRRIFKEYELH